MSGHLYEVIRRDVLRGLWTPGSRLQLSLLAEHYGASVTVIREALTRLATERMVNNHPQRGFFVQELSLEELHGLTLVRKHSDALALRLSIEHGDLAWESALITSHHVLARTPSREPSDPHRATEEWSEAHRDFHLALISACGIPVLQEWSKELLDSTELYRWWSAPFDQTTHRDVAGEHAEILEAALARDVDRAVALLCDHYQRSHDTVVETGLLAP